MNDTVQQSTHRCALHRRFHMWACSHFSVHFEKKKKKKNVVCACHIKLVCSFALSSAINWFSASAFLYTHFILLANWVFSLQRVRNVHSARQRKRRDKPKKKEMRKINCQVKRAYKKATHNISINSLGFAFVSFYMFYTKKKSVKLCILSIGGTTEMWFVSQSAHTNRATASISHF